ncbi:hypothetical protein MPOCJGCO_1341 [Methylobacterium trifolii]|uniref:Uncharacterized protein n=1 Tax=Methylobacterium trifolii TaxID=1003092 RepID=A0ABQ4TX32_9HYPH|nr:hypothetical protein MPOCJGCO_1341 [Methylobacterium trifolii]
MREAPCATLRVVRITTVAKRRSSAGDFAPARIAGTGVSAKAAGSGASPETSLSHSARSNRPAAPSPALTVWTKRSPLRRTRRVRPAARRLPSAVSK